MIKNFNSFIKSTELKENSIADFSLHNWTDGGQDEMPLNSGFEGTSAEEMDFTGGAYDEDPEEDESIIDVEYETGEKIEHGFGLLKSALFDLTERIKRLEDRKSN